MLVVIGPRWLDARGSDGARRLDDPADVVRLEIEAAVRLRLAVIPILLEEARMPTSAELPDALRPLAFINGVVVRDDPDFARDMERLLVGLDRAVAARTAAARRFGRRGGAATGVAGGATALPTAPASADVTPSEQLTRTRGTRRRPALAPLARRPLLAGMAALLVGTSLAVLLATHYVPFLAASNQQHPTQTATTATTPTETIPVPTATPLFGRPYRASEPGHLCDKGAAEWFDLGQTDAGMTCLPQNGGARMVGVQQSQEACGGATACYLNQATLASSPQASFPVDASVTLSIAHLQGNDGSQASFAIWVQPMGTTLQVHCTFSISGSGGPWSSTRLENGNLTTLRTDTGSPGGIYTVAFTISGRTVGYTVNGTYYPSPIIERAAVTLTQLQFDVSGSGAKPQADFANFELDPLP